MAMQRWRQHLYFAEFVLVAVPIAILQFCTLPLLIRVLPSAAPAFSLLLFALWVGGCFGTYALWSMYFRIYKNQGVQSLTELPWLPLAAGTTANVVPVFYFIFSVTKPNQWAVVASCLVLLAPVYVSIHWVSVLRNIRHA